MKAGIKKHFEIQTVMMRDTYCRTLMEMAEDDENIVALDADLMNSMGMNPFIEKYPDRTFNCGVQEANMIGVAAGLSAVGKIPFAHTFGPFASRRCCDQIYISAAYAKLNVRIIGSDPGITAAYNGGTHMPFEDMGILRGIPETTLIEPVDNVMLEDIMKQVAKLYGVYYIRLLRKYPIGIYEKDSTFEIGRGIVLKDGSDVTIFSSGILVHESLKAHDILKNEGISARVVNLFTWKPIDEELIEKCAIETGAAVTAENHNIINGLGSAVAEVLAERKPIPLERIGSRDLFGEVGPVDYLIKRYNMTAEDIVASAKKAIYNKRL